MPPPLSRVLRLLFQIFLESYVRIKYDSNHAEATTLLIYKSEMRTNFTAYHCLFISRGFKSCFYSKTGKRQHKIETYFCEAQKLRFCPKNSKKP